MFSKVCEGIVFILEMNFLVFLLKKFRKEEIGRLENSLLRFHPSGDSKPFITICREQITKYVKKGASVYDALKDYYKDEKKVTGCRFCSVI